MQKKSSKRKQPAEIASGDLRRRARILARFFVSIYLVILAKVEQIRSLINAPVENKKYLWDMTVDAYAKTMEQVSRVLGDEVFSEEKDDSEFKNLRDALKSFLTRCASPEFQIAFVGTIKAGKSTLINALLNYVGINARNAGNCRFDEI